MPTISTTIFVMNWRPSAVAEFTLLDTYVGAIPIEFMETAHVNDWSYVRYVLQSIVSLPDNFEIFDGDNLVSGTPRGTNYRIMTTTPTRCTDDIVFQKGPQGASSGRAARDLIEVHTDSDSSVESVGPTDRRFREALLARDSRCLVTKTRALDTIVACHIVPQGLEQSYLDEIIGRSYVVQLNSPGNGLLLHDDFQRAFDNFRFGIYYKDGGLYVHSFDALDVFNSRNYHGQRIEFREDCRDQWPHLALLDWHYKQCLMARVRGFSAGGLF